MAESVLVTGGTGYVAGWCMVELLRRGYDVRTTVRSLAKVDAIRASIATEIDPGDRLSFHVADLTSDDGWADALAGVDYVLHVASPLGTGATKNPDDLIIPARDGAVRVLRAATEAGVKRVVMTSACAAASPALYTDESVTDETLWTDPDDPRLTTYRKSKTLAERAAWDFMASYDGPTTLTTILPGAVFGPVLTPSNAGSVEVIGRLLEGRMPGTPRLGFEVVDVRDLADIHLRAMTSPEAAGQRFIAVGDFLWMSDIATSLRARLGQSARKVPTRRLPDFVLKAMSVFDASLRDITPALGRRHRHSPATAERLLDWKARAGAETVADCGESLLAAKAIVL